MGIGKENWNYSIVCDAGGYMGTGDITPIVENQMKKELENGVDTGWRFP